MNKLPMCCKVTQIIQNHISPRPNSINPLSDKEWIKHPNMPCDLAP